MIIDGKKISEDVLADLRKEQKQKNFFAAVLVGENQISESFVLQKEKIAKDVGIDFRIYRFQNEITQDKLREEILKIVKHKTCGGLIVQLPLPSHINSQYVMNVIPKEKDVDVLGERALGAFYAGRNFIFPPAVCVVEEIMNFQKIDLKGKKIAVVGLGVLVGRPISVWLEKKCIEFGAEIYLLDKGGDLDVLKDADLIILGTGQANLINSEMIKSGAVVVDFGYGHINGKLCGDFDVKNKIKNLDKIYYTPTPGGTGPILVTKLFQNFFTLIKYKNK